MKRRCISVLSIGLLLTLFACGGGKSNSSSNTPPGTSPTPPPTGPSATPTPTPLTAPQFVYTTNAGSFDLSGFKINQDGSLTAVPGFPVTPPRSDAPFFSGATSMANIGRFLLVPSSDPNAAAGIASYVIDTKIGALALTPQLPSPATDNFRADGPFAVDATRMIVYVGGSWFQAIPNGTTGGIGIGAYKVNNNGTLSPLPGSPLHVNLIGALGLDPSHNFLYVASQGQIQSIPLNSDGSLGNPGAPMPLPGALVNPPESEPCVFALQGSVVVHPSGKFLIATCTGSSAINVLSVSATGQMTVVQTLTPPDASSEFTSLALNPAGTLAAATQEATNTIVVFSVDQSNGTLTQIASAPAGTRPNSISFDHSGSFLYATNGSSVLSKNITIPGSNNLSGYAISTTGTLTPVPNSPVATGTFPRSIVVVQP